MKDSYYIGTDLKYLIQIEAEGFSMDDDNYTIVLRCNGREITVPKEDIVEGDNDDHYLLVDTSQFGSGMLKMIVYAEVPDDNFSDGARTEVASFDLCELKKV